MGNKQISKIKKQKHLAVSIKNRNFVKVLVML